MSWDKNNDNFKQLLKKLAEGDGKDFVAILGAGASKNAELPLWAELRDELANLLEQHSKDIGGEPDPNKIQRIKTKPDLWDAFTELKRDLGEKYYTYIENRLDISSRDVPDIYSYLWDMNIGGIITFNLDRFAIQSYSKKEQSVIQFSHWKEPQKYQNYLANGKPYVFHAHGDLADRTSWIMTRSERNNLYSNDQFKKFMGTLLNSKNLLIIGFNPDEYTFLKLLTDLSIFDGKLAGNNYCILTDINPEDYQKYEEYGISIINYSPTDKAQHSEVSDILRTLRDQRESKDKAIEEPLESVSSAGLQPIIPTYADIGQYTPNQLRNILNLAVSHIRLDNKGDSDKSNEEKIMNFYEEHGLLLNIAWYVDVKGKNGENLFHDYLLEDEVNKGSFGKIYRAIKFDDADKKSLAIKVLLQEVNKEIDYLNCFRRGVRAMKFISDNGILGVVKIHEAFEVPNSIVMDYIDGFTLREAIDGRHVQNFGSKLKIIKQVTETILAVHNLPQSVLHRDIKPENIIIENYFSPSDDINIKIVDFDLAWHRGATERTVMATGSIGFVAPEQTVEKGKRDTRSKAVDVYSIGMLLYYLFLEENPPANYHFSPEFKKNIISKIKSKYRTNWAVLPEYIAETIVEATQHIPTERISLSSFLSRLQIIESLYLSDEIDQANFILLLELAKNIDPLESINLQANQEKSEVILKQIAVNRDITFSTSVRNREMILNVAIYKSRGDGDARGVRDYFGRIINKARSKIDANLFKQTNFRREEEQSAIRICLAHTLKETLNSTEIKQLTKNIVEICQELQFQ